MAVITEVGEGLELVLAVTTGSLRYERVLLSLVSGDGEIAGLVERNSTGMMLGEAVGVTLGDEVGDGAGLGEAVGLSPGVANCLLMKIPRKVEWG